MEIHLHLILQHVKTHRLEICRGQKQKKIKNPDFGLDLDHFHHALRTTHSVKNGRNGGVPSAVGGNAMRALSAPNPDNNAINVAKTDIVRASGF